MPASPIMAALTNPQPLRRNAFEWATKEFEDAKLRQDAGRISGSVEEASLTPHFARSSTQLKPPMRWDRRMDVFKAIRAA